MATTAPRPPLDYQAETVVALSSALPSRRTRLARQERPLLLAGLALVTLHLLDLAFAGPATTAAGVFAIVAVPILAAVLQPRVTRLSRFLLAVPVGLLFAAAGALAHGLDLFTSGPRWTDASGVGFMLGGLLIVASGTAALAARPRSPRRTGRGWQVAHTIGWLTGAFVIGQFVVLPLVAAVITTHATRLPVDDGALGTPHQTVRLDSPVGELAAWYVPSRNGAAVLVAHGSGSNRSDVAAQADLVARRGFGVLSIDLPGHGESDGRANLLGSNAQPAVRAGLDWLSRRPGVDPDRIGGFGMSLGGEVLLEAAARDTRLRAVVSDGAERARDDRELDGLSAPARAVSIVQTQSVRAVSGTREPSPLLHLLGRIAPRRVLLIAAGGRPDEIPMNRAYRDATGPSAELWTLPEAGHTRGVTARPDQYEQRVLAFLERSLAPP